MSLAFVLLVVALGRQVAIGDMLARLESSVATTRIEALGQLLNAGVPRAEPYNVDAQTRELLRRYPADADRIALALIASLERENRRVRDGAPGSLSEADTEHYADNVAAVAALGDGRALNALLGAIGTGGMATSGIARLGEIVVRPLITLLGSPDGATRHSAAIALGKLAASRATSPLSAASVSEMRTALQRALTDPNRFVRESAALALARLN